MDKISVIVPVYKVEEYLSQCLDSIINNTYKNLEIICVDDGSPDNCGKILDEYAKKDSRIKVIHQDNGGLSVARNTGIDNATGDWISFIDSDDYIALDYYETMIKAAKESGADVIQCGHSVFSDKINKTHTYKPTIVEGFSNIIKGFKRGYVWNKLWKRELIRSNNLRFYPRIYIEDVLFSMIAANFIKKFQIIDYVGNFYRSNPNSISQSPEKKDKIRQDTYLICEEILKFYKNLNLTEKEKNELNKVVFLLTFSPLDILNKSVYKKCAEIFGSGNMLKKYRIKAIKNWIFRISFSRKEMIILGKRIKFN